MIGTWYDCQGNFKPKEYSERDGFSVLTRNVAQIDEDLWQYQEFKLKKEDYLAITGATSVRETELAEGLMETFEATLNNSAELEDCRAAIIELYEMMEG